MQQKTKVILMAALCLAAAAVLSFAIKGFMDDKDGGTGTSQPAQTPQQTVSQEAENGTGEEPAETVSLPEVSIADPFEDLASHDPDEEHENSFEDSEASASGILGTWYYQDGTYYEFNADLTGAMYYDTYKFDYVYTLDGDKLHLDFDREEVSDMDYSYELLEEDKLQLTLSQGDTEAVYQLSRYK